MALVLFALGMLWIGGRIDVASAGERAAERAGGQVHSRITAYAGDTPWRPVRPPR
ncbi:hypothetical protein [Streptosporangium sp. NPDC023615]|uniref:hypothetical protein n=1 Tax=Streptosporangium sp. NPDC023615 TaxID=3154794 RepID=UPI00342BAF4F